jgi:VWFA-related protein
MFVMAQTAQDAVRPDTELQRSSPILVDVDLVNMVFAVLDKKGRFVTDLKEDQFTVFEDNELQRITNFSRETDLPLTVALVIDTSGSIRDKLRFEQEAAVEFFLTSLRAGTDKGLIITFDSSVDLLQDYTDDPQRLADAVKKITAGGGTSLYDALYLAVAEKLSGQKGRRVIILITDGDDNSSRVSMTETLEAAQHYDVVIYAISTNRIAGLRTRDMERGDNVLKTFADETGGRVFSPTKIHEMTKGFQSISSELRAQYTLAYRPTNVQRDGAFRRVRIEVSDKRLKPRARPGYYAPRE